jgi:hypothetical protein
MTQSVNFRWPQGEDLNIQLIYKEGASSKVAKAIDLSGYSLRMDIFSADGSSLYEYTSMNNPGTLGSGLNGEPNVNIFLPRSLTLPGGTIYTKMTDNPSQTAFNYDLFLRNLSTTRQFKVIRGMISIEKSVTLWL